MKHLSIQFETKEELVKELTELLSLFAPALFTDKADEVVETAPASEVDETPAPKKRGRPAKTAAPEVDSEVIQVEVNDGDMGEVDLSDLEEETPPAPAPKKAAPAKAAPAPAAKEMTKDDFTKRISNYVTKYGLSGKKKVKDMLTTYKTKKISELEPRRYASALKMIGA